MSCRSIRSRLGVRARRALSTGLGLVLGMTVAAVGPLAGQAYAAVSDPAATVNTLIGSQNHGETLPGAATPFGMVQWSPESTAGNQTREVEPGGYSYDFTKIRGFSLTHLSGTGCAGASGDIPFLPYPGSVSGSPSSDTTDATYASTFSHANETGTAGYYKVGLDSGVTVELSATTHTGAARLTYPSGKPATLLVRTSNSEVGSTAATTSVNTAADTISGSVTSGNFCGYINPVDRRSYYTLSNGAVITVNAPAAATNTPYIQSFAVNGTSSTKPWLPESFVAAGGTLDETVGTSADTSWGSAVSDAPPSFDTGSLPGNDFSLAASPSSGSAAAGSSTVTTVSTSALSGSAETVTLSASGLPSGATASFSPSSVTAGGSATLTIATSASTPAGTFPITVTGTAASATHSASYSLAVTSISGGGGIPNGAHTIAASGKALDDPNHSTTAGTQLITWTPTGGGNQSWVFTLQSDGSYQIVNSESNLCVDVSGASTSPGAQIIQWTCHGGSNQRWIVTPLSGGGYTIASQSSGLLLTTASTADGSPATQQANTGTPLQHWTIT